MFSWFDSYDIYDETGTVVFTVKGRLSWGHCLEIFDYAGTHVGTVKEEILTFLPRFALYAFGNYIGEIKKEFTFFKPVFTLNCNDWTVQGDWLEWDYQVLTSSGGLVMQASKELYTARRRSFILNDCSGNRRSKVFERQLVFCLSVP